MAGEIQVNFTPARTVYAIIRDRNGLVWNTANSAFEVFAGGSIADYDVALTEQGSSGLYAGNFPVTITAGLYGVIAKQQLGGTPALSDPTVGVGDVQWSGTAALGLSDLASSGQVAQFAPVRVARGVMIQNFPIYLKSSADHITPLVSGVVSGQIARDNGSFGPLQSGAFTETGLGFYNLQALTSGDLAGGTIKLLFTAVGVSGGTSDPLPLSFITQRVSGY